MSSKETDRIFKRSLLLSRLETAESALLRARGVVEAIENTSPRGRGGDFYLVHPAYKRAVERCNTAFDRLEAAERSLSEHETEHPDLGWMESKDE